jgi:hypothetical protein
MTTPYRCHFWKRGYEQAARRLFRPTIHEFLSASLPSSVDYHIISLVSRGRLI